MKLSLDALRRGQNDDWLTVAGIVSDCVALDSTKNRARCRASSLTTRKVSGCPDRPTSIVSRLTRQHWSGDNSFTCLSSLALSRKGGKMHEAALTALCAKLPRGDFGKACFNGKRQLKIHLSVQQ